MSCTSKQIVYFKLVNYTVHRENIRIASRYVRSCSAPSVIREIQINTTMRYGKSKIPSSDSAKYWRACGETGSVMCRCWECGAVRPLWTSLGSFSSRVLGPLFMPEKQQLMHEHKPVCDGSEQFYCNKQNLETTRMSYTRC
jgi:hypothetical protein